jgi:hypothetical protein
MDSLDDLAGAGDVSSNAYNVLAKKLKDVHDSTDAGKMPVVESVVMEYAMAEPSTLTFAPPSVQTWSPVFVRTLTLKFLSATEDEHYDLPSASVWKDKIVTHYMGMDGCVLDEARIRDAIELFTAASPDQFVTPIVANLNKLYKNMAMSAWEIFEEDGDEMVRLAETSPPFREALISLLDETNKEQVAVQQRLYAMRKDGDILPCHHDLVDCKRAGPLESDAESDSDMSSEPPDTNPDTNPETGRVQDREHNDSESESYEECECPRCLAMQAARSAIRLRDDLAQDAIAFRSGTGM